MEATVPRGRGIDRSLQLSCARLMAANDHLEDWEVWSRESVRSVASQLGTSKSTVHRLVNQDALHADRRRSRRRRERLRRQSAK
jgi:IS30 family transposase